METRMKLNEVEPESYNLLLAFEKFVSASALTKTHRDLIKIRASQLNGCAYCIDSHTRDARKSGESEQRIYALTAWKEMPFFTEDERAVLALTEEVTLIHNRVSDSTYQNAVNVLGEKYTAQVIVAIIAINGWNRIGVFTQMAPAIN